jgi:hypothetical protein
MPTSKPVKTLPIGRWVAPTTEFPKNMADVDFRFDEIPLEDHPFHLALPMFAPPGILWSKVPSTEFKFIGAQTSFDGPPSAWCARGTDSRGTPV